MCILYFCQSELCQAGSYWLVMANNRDECWPRPTKEADFWGEQKSCISGLDQQEGRAGGTWIGMNKQGRIGVLLNILGQMDLTKEGRGFLVSDFLCSKEDIDDYAAKIFKQRDKYNGFNLLLFDLGKQEDNFTCKPVYISNAKNYQSCVHRRTLPTNTFFGVSNSPLEYPFQKVVEGRGKFGKIVSQYPQVRDKSHLIDKLLDLLADRTSLLPDPVLEQAASSVGFSPQRTSQHSAINVFSPQVEYGSRTSTVLLVDSEGNVDYVERTVSFEDVHNPTSSINHKTFSLQSQRGTQGVK